MDSIRRFAQAAVLLAFVLNPGLDAADSTKKAVADLERAGATLTYDPAGSVTVLDLSTMRYPASDLDMANVEQLPTIEYINLSGTAVTDDGLASLQRLQKLRTVLMPAGATNRGLKPVGEITTLRAITLTGAKISGDGLSRIKAATELMWLDLGGASITDEDAVQLRVFRNLRFLSLGNTKITDDGLQHVASMTKLETLFLPRATTDKGLLFLREMKNLKRLYLFNCAISNASGPILGRLTGLEELNLYGTAVGDAFIESIPSLRNLEYLNVGKTNVTTAGAARARELMPKLAVQTE